MAEQLETQSRSAQIDIIQKFLSTFKKNGEYSYIEQIDKMQAKNSAHIILDFNDVTTASFGGDLLPEDLVEKMVDDSDEYFYMFSKAVKNILEERFPKYAAKIEGKIRIRITNFPIISKIREVDADSISKLVKIRGIIVRASKVQPIAKKIAYVCPDFHRTFIQKDQAVGGFVRPTKCTHEKCAHRDLRISPKESEFVDFQIITLQELPEELPPGRLPNPVTTVAIGDLVDTARPGDRVFITGPVNIGMGKEYEFFGSMQSFHPYINANNIELMISNNLTGSGSAGIQDISETEEKFLRSIISNDNLEKILISSYAPLIKGHEIIKEAILYMNTAPEQMILSDGSKRRGDVNIFLVGDPGIAKSELLKFSIRIAPRGIYTSGRGSTAAGLTAAVLRDTTGIYMLEAGAMVLADQGLCAIDEFDKMKPEDRSALHEGMEQQTVSINKGGIIATLNARTSILAAANPIYGKYDEFKNLTENVNVPIPLLTRFDLIFIVKDIPNKENDKKISEHIRSLYSKKKNFQGGPLSPEMLTKYILYVKQNDPDLSDEASQELDNFYQKMRNLEQNDGMFTITPRYLNSLIRITLGRARLLNKKEADIDDAMRAIAIMEYMFQTAGVDVNTGKVDLGVLQGTTSQDVGRLSLFIDVLKALQGEHHISVERVVLISEMVKTGKWDEHAAKDFISKMLRDSIIFEAKPGYYSRIV